MLLFNNQSRFLSTGKLQNLTSLYAVHTFLYNEHHGGMLMKVLLVRPFINNILTISGFLDTEPLELEYLYTACMQCKFTAQIYDSILEAKPFTQVLKQFKPDAVAITGYLTQEKNMQRYAALAKQIDPDIKVIIGGVHAQINYERLFWPQVDFILRSEAMEAFKQLLSNLNQPDEYRNINGLCFRNKTTFIINPLLPCEINELPIPYRIELNHHSEAFRYLDYDHCATIKTSFSCPFKCSFCYGRNLHQGIVSCRTIDKVINELQTISSTNVFITDSDFLYDENRLRMLIKALKEKQIKKQFICYGRSDFIAAHPDLMKELAAVGFSCVLVGFESINTSTLTAYNKQNNGSINDACIDVLNESGIACTALMIADLSFTHQDFKALYQWLISKPLQYASVQILTPLPGTDYHEQNKDKLLDHDIRKWDLAHVLMKPPHLSRSRFMLEYQYLVIRLWLYYRRHGSYQFFTFSYMIHQLKLAIQRQRALH